MISELRMEIEKERDVKDNWMWGGKVSGYLLRKFAEG